jgi:hypothetical protein
MAELVVERGAQVRDRRPQQRGLALDPSVPSTGGDPGP